MSGKLTRTMVQKLARCVLAVALAAVFVPATLVLSACTTDPAHLKYLDQTITVSGLGNGDVTVSIRDLTQLESVTEKAEGARSNGAIVKFTAVGPTLETFLNAYGKSRSDFTSVRFYASDGFSVILPKEVLEKRTIVLAYMNGGKALDKKNAPLRLVVVGERAMYWARMVSGIEFLTEDDVARTNKLVFLDTVLPALGGEFNDEEKGTIVSTIDLLDAYGGLDNVSKVQMLAFDKLRKVETMANFLKGYIKYTGDDTPQFCSPELPEGMNLNGIVSIRSGDVAYFSLERATGLFFSENRTREFNNQTGIGFADIVSETAFVTATTFRFESIDGEVRLLSDMDVAKGIFVNQDDVWSFIGPNDTLIANIAVIEAVDPVLPDPAQQAEQAE